ncbi:hypothetical protein EVAR_27651_1 [Eumeta japonica]|uniref:Uncharacterized protein n=1 Tax=Eumeta variegata TaxID=151549 RepID=A0A4C1V1R3_EUMVA|nr:hypothetical protein EVAR_27651_1 [Eumeta japonica]
MVVIMKTLSDDQRVEQRLGFFQVLTSDSGYLDAGTFILHGADACASGAVDRYQTSAGAIQRMFPDQQPAHMREEKPSRSIMRVCISVAILVMEPVVPHPVCGRVLKSEAIQHQQDQSQGQLSFVTPVCPKSMCTGGDP